MPIFNNKNNEKKSLELASVIFRNKEIDDTDIDGEKVMMNLNKGEYFMLNTVAADIWDSINEPKTINEVVNELLEKYDIDYKTCEDEVMSFINELNDADLIKVQ